MTKRSHEPVFWSLFGAGGVLTALLLPGLVIATGLAIPLGLASPESLSYERIAAFAGSAAGKLFLFLVVSLTLWHAMHRVFHGLHDLGVHRWLPLWKVMCYGAALAGTVVTAIRLLAI